MSGRWVWGRGEISRRRLLYLAGSSALGVGFGLLNPLRSIGPSSSDPGSSAAPAGPPTGSGSGSGSEPISEAGTKSSAKGSGFALWSDPATWKGKIPGAADIARIDIPIMLDVDATVAGVIVGPKGVLLFDPKRSRTLKSHRNVIVTGRLTMRPASAAVVHTLSILDANESKFQGGGGTPLSSDVGLWVVDEGVLDAVGTAKRAWSRASATVAKGATSVTLVDAPSGWRVGDEVVLTPTIPPTSKNHHAAYDVAKVKSISGRTVRLSSATKYAHPRVKVTAAKSFGAEVMNLTRNVRIEGRKGHRAHVFMRSLKRQTIKYVAIREVGPRQGPAGASKGVLGRYGLHFHIVGGNARGSLVQGVVVRDTGHHAFVPHASDGVTFRDCIAHDVMEEAYWWDPGPGNATQDVLYDRCVASNVRTDPDFRGFRLAGFWLGHGVGNRMRDCVAVGVRGAVSSSGFIWPEGSGAGRSAGDGVWGFEDSVAHNNKVDGIFAWQNDNNRHRIVRFVGYHNGQAGIDHGAYTNNYEFKDSVLYGNGVAALLLHAVSGAAAPGLDFSKVVFDAAGMSNYAVLAERHTLPAKRHTSFTGCSLRGMKKAAFGVVETSGKNADLIDVVSCSFTGNEFWLGDGIVADTLIRVQDAKHGTIAIRRSDQQGTYSPDWNAKVEPIAPFA